MAHTGMFVAPLAGSPPVGMSPTDGRLVMGGIFQVASQLVAGGGYTPSASVMQLTVNQAVWSLTDPTNAAAVFFTPTDQITLTFGAAPGTGGRIDLVVVKQNNVENGDADSRVNVSVVAGVASGSPVAPAVPAGASKYLAVLINAGVTNIAAATVTNYMQTMYANPPLQAPTQAALYSAPGVPSQLAVVTADSTSTNNGLYFWSNSAWLPVKPIVSYAVGSNQSVSTGTIIVTGLSVTITLAAPTNLRVKVGVSMYGSTSDCIANIAVLDGASAVATATRMANSSPSITATSVYNNIEIPLRGVAAGTHTYTVQVSRPAGSGTVTVAPNAQSPSFLSVEVES